MELLLDTREISPGSLSHYCGAIRRLTLHVGNKGDVAVQPGAIVSSILTDVTLVSFNPVSKVTLSTNAVKIASLQSLYVQAQHVVLEDGCLRRLGLSRHMKLRSNCIENNNVYERSPIDHDNQLVLLKFSERNELVIIGLGENKGFPQGIVTVDSETTAAWAHKNSAETRVFIQPKQGGASVPWEAPPSDENEAEDVTASVQD